MSNQGGLAGKKRAASEVAWKHVLDRTRKDVNLRLVVEFQRTSNVAFGIQITASHLQSV